MPYVSPYLNTGFTTYSSYHTNNINKDYHNSGTSDDLPDFDFYDFINPIYDREELQEFTTQQSKPDDQPQNQDQGN